MVPAWVQGWERTLFPEVFVSMDERTVNILTIAGSDSGGGAGIQADLKTIMAMGCYGMSAITALTAQNGMGVTGIFPASPDFVLLQLKTVADGFHIHAAKTGMLFNAGIIHAVASFLKDHAFPLVVDPVSVATSGSRLLETSAVEALVGELLPLADLVTPNIPEAEMLSGMSIHSLDDQEKAGRKILDLGPSAVLVKGGHRPDGDGITDVLVRPGQKSLHLPQALVRTENTHGTGCTLSSAIASGLGEGLSLEDAVLRAQNFLHCALENSVNPGKGPGPVNHAAWRSRGN